MTSEIGDLALNVLIERWIGGVAQSGGSQSWKWSVQELVDEGWAAGRHVAMAFWKSCIALNERLDALRSR